MAKYQIKVEIKDPDDDPPTLPEFERLAQTALQAIYPAAEVTVYDAERADID